MFSVTAIPVWTGASGVFTTEAWDCSATGSALLDDGFLLAPPEEPRLIETAALFHPGIAPLFGDPKTLLAMAGRPSAPVRELSAGVGASAPSGTPPLGHRWRTRHTPLIQRRLDAFDLKQLGLRLTDPNAGERERLRAVSILADYFERHEFIRHALQRGVLHRNQFPRVQKEAEAVLKRFPEKGIREAREKSETHRLLAGIIPPLLPPAAGKIRAKEFQIGEFFMRVSVFECGPREAPVRLVVKMFHGALDREAIGHDYLGNDFRILQKVQEKYPSATLVVLAGRIDGAGARTAAVDAAKAFFEGTAIPPRQVLLLTPEREGAERWVETVLYGSKDTTFPVPEALPAWIISAPAPKPTPKKPRGRRTQTDVKRLLESVRLALEKTELKRKAGEPFSATQIVNLAFRLYLKDWPKNRPTPKWKNFENVSLRGYTSKAVLAMLKRGGIRVQPRARINKETALAAFQKALAQLKGQLAGPKPVRPQAVANLARQVYLKMTPDGEARASLSRFRELVSGRRKDSEIVALLKRAGVRGLRSNF
ncbi:MAG: hypothetical protein HY609_04670 [Deltaproteobacteria bacterium]|nr:hypothetical protein [Deltaproteobacteria bacterium]MBI4224204.1 hypothetical protein [Deltaproteobacteria bacterium]